MLHHYNQLYCTCTLYSHKFKLCSICLQHMLYTALHMMVKNTQVQCKGVFQKVLKQKGIGSVDYTLTLGHS